MNFNNPTYRMLFDAIGIPVEIILNEFIPDEEWTLEYFIQDLSFRNGRLVYSGDYVSGRHMKTDITFEPGGRVTLETRNRGKGADRWMLHLQGKKHIQLAETS